MSKATLQAVQGAKINNLRFSAVIVVPNTPYLAKEIPLAAQLKLQAYHYNIRNRENPKVMADANHDQFMSFIAGVKALGANPRVDLIFDIENYNLTSDVDHVIAKFYPSGSPRNGKILWGFETIDSPGLIGAEYNAVALAGDAKLAGTGLESWWDNGLNYRTSGNTWARIIALSSLPIRDIRTYTQMEDQFKTTGNVVTDFAGILNYFDFLLPTQWFDTTNMNSYASRLPGRKIANIQCHWENYDQNPKNITGRPLGNFAMGKMVTFELRNADRVSYHAHMSNQTLINGDTPNPHYWDLKRVVPLGTYKTALQLWYADPSLQGAAAANDAAPDGSRDYIIVTTNKSDSDIVIPFADFVIQGGGKIQGKVRRDCGYGMRGWDSAETTNEPLYDDTSFLYRRNSTTVHYLTAKKVAEV